MWKQNAIFRLLKEKDYLSLFLINSIDSNTDRIETSYYDNGTARSEHIWRPISLVFWVTVETGGLRLCVEWQKQKDQPGSHVLWNIFIFLHPSYEETQNFEIRNAENSGKIRSAFCTSYTDRVLRTNMSKVIIIVIQYIFIQFQVTRTWGDVKR